MKIFDSEMTKGMLNRNGNIHKFQNPLLGYQQDDCEKGIRKAMNHRLG